LYNELLENTDGTVAKRHIRIKQIKKNKGSVEGSVNRLRGIPNEKISLLRGKSRHVGLESSPHHSTGPESLIFKHND
jgi:hypothetical protein